MSDTEEQVEIPKGRPISPNVIDTILIGAGPAMLPTSARPSRPVSPLENGLQRVGDFLSRAGSPDVDKGRHGRAKSAEGRRQPKRNDVISKERVKEIKYIVRDRDEDRAPKKNPFKAPELTTVNSVQDLNGHEILRQLFQERMTGGAIADDDFVDDTLSRGVDVSDAHIVKPARLFGKLDMNEDQIAHLRNFKKDSRNMITAEFSLKYVEKLCSDFKHQLSEQTILDHLYLVLPDKCLQDWQRLRDTPGMKLRQVYKELCTLYGNAKSQKYLRQELLSICADMESEVRDVLNRIHVNLSRTESSSIRERNLRCLEEVQIYLKRRIGPTSAALIFTRFEARKLSNFSDLIDLIEADFPEVFAKDKIRREKGRLDRGLPRARVHEVLQDHPVSDDDDVDEDVDVVNQVEEKFSALLENVVGKSQEENAKQFADLVDRLENVNNVVQGRGVCHACGQVGHFARDCPDKRGGSSKKGNKGRYCDQPCSVPNHKGHINKDCLVQKHPCGAPNHRGHPSRNCYRYSNWEYQPVSSETASDPDTAVKLEIQQLRARIDDFSKLLEAGQAGNR